MAITVLNSPRAVISGSGFSVPPNVVTNDDLSEFMDTDHDWIVERTGISERRWAAPELSASELALPACKAALNRSGILAADLDGIIVATVTPDYIFPSTAAVIQGKLGAKGGLAFDVNAVCSGFVYALSVAASLMAGGAFKHVLVVGVDLYSRIIDKSDRSTAILFGDGAGAIVLSREDQIKNGAGRGVHSYSLGCDGSLGDLLCVKSGTAKEPTAESLGTSIHALQMNGKEIFKLAVRAGVEGGKELCSAIGISPPEIDYLMFHQANQRILSSVGKQLGLKDEQVLSNVAKYGNTSAASIPILLAESAEQGILQPGQLLLLSAFGGGVTWGGALVRY